MYTIKQTPLYSSDEGLISACFSGSHRHRAIVQTGDYYCTRSIFLSHITNLLKKQNVSVPGKENSNFQSTFHVLFSEIMWNTLIQCEHDRKFSNSLRLIPLYLFFLSILIYYIFQSILILVSFPQNLARVRLNQGSQFSVTRAAVHFPGSYRWINIFGNITVWFVLLLYHLKMFC